MKEHEKLKKICDEIKVDAGKYDELVGYYTLIAPTYKRKRNVREIIFTQDFIDKLQSFVNKENKTHFEILWNGVARKLDNPVDYLYFLIFTDE